MKGLLMDRTHTLSPLPIRSTPSMRIGERRNHWSPRRRKEGTCCFITDSEVNTCLRTAAQTAHNIPTGDANLDKWSTHSIRITACNLLHRQKFSDSYIQNRLRWKSECWKDYLRNTFCTANQHTILLSDTNLPHFRNITTQRPNEPHEDIMEAA